MVKLGSARYHPNVRSIYIETSVWAMIGADQPAVLRDLTIDFLDRCADGQYSPHISDVVGDELRRASQPAQQAVLSQLHRVNPLNLPMLEEVEQLAQGFILQGILGERRIDDARHVACALVHELDVLVSWNYRHIANVRKSESFNAVAVLAGIHGNLEIRTPMELIE